MSFVCPKCRKDVSLYRNVEVPGWQSVGGDLEPIRHGHPDREAEWDHATPTGEYGCGECGWEGMKDQLREPEPPVPLGIDGEPLPVVGPDQIALDVAT